MIGEESNRVPKSYHVGLNILCVGVYDAIAHFNYGEKATLDVLDYINLEPGIFTKTMPSTKSENVVLLIELLRQLRSEGKSFATSRKGNRTK